MKQLSYHTHNSSSFFSTKNETRARDRCRTVTRIQGETMQYIVYQIGEQHVKYFNLSEPSFKEYSLTL
jgi:hypothetical protein